MVTLARSTDDGRTWSEDLVGSAGPSARELYARTDAVSMDGPSLNRACVIAYSYTGDSPEGRGPESGERATPATGGMCTDAFEFAGKSVGGELGTESAPGGGDDGAGGGIGAG